MAAAESAAAAVAAGALRVAGPALELRLSRRQPHPLLVDDEPVCMAASVALATSLELAAISPGGEALVVPRLGLRAMVGVRCEGGVRARNYGSTALFFRWSALQAKYGDLSPLPSVTAPSSIFQRFFCAEIEGRGRSCIYMRPFVRANGRMDGDIGASMRVVWNWVSG